MPDILDELERLGHSIDEAKEDKLRAEIGLENDLKNLAEKFNLEEEDIPKELESFDQELLTIETEMNEKFGKLQQDYEW